MTSDLFPIAEAEGRTVGHMTEELVANKNSKKNENKGTDSWTDP